MNKKEKIWVALSDLFIDNEISYEFIARRIYQHANLDEIYFNLFEFVAPICYANFLSIISPVWDGFDEEWLFEEIEKLQTKLEKSGFARFKHKFAVVYYKKRFDADWQKLKAEIIKKQTSPENLS